MLETNIASVEIFYNECMRMKMMTGVVWMLQTKWNIPERLMNVKWSIQGLSDSSLFMWI